MTLCLLWKNDGNINMISDSRFTLLNSHADIAIKINSIPYRIYSPCDSSTGIKKIHFEGDLGMCFAGSAINSLFMKETIVEIFKNLQYVPGQTAVSMKKLADIFFKAYKNISKQICETELAETGISEIVIAGKCHEAQKLRAFKFETDIKINEHSYSEVLVEEGSYLISGSRKKVVEEEIKAIGTKPTSLDFFKILKKIIDDDAMPEVGGNIQCGRFKNDLFVIYGIVDYTKGERPKYLRGSLDLNSREFDKDSDDLGINYEYLNPFDVFKTPVQ